MRSVLNGSPFKIEPGGDSRHSFQAMAEVAEGTTLHKTRFIPELVDFLEKRKKKGSTDWQSFIDHAPNLIEAYTHVISQPYKTAEDWREEWDMKYCSQPMSLRDWHLMDMEVLCMPVKKELDKRHEKVEQQ